MAKDTPILIEVGQGLSLPLGRPTISCWVTTSRPKKPMKRTFGLNTQTNSLEFWDGNIWLTAPLKIL